MRACAPAFPPSPFVSLPPVRACHRTAAAVAAVAMTRPAGLADGPAGWNSEGRREKAKGKGKQPKRSGTPAPNQTDDATTRRTTRTAALPRTHVRGIDNNNAQHRAQRTLRVKDQQASRQDWHEQKSNEGGRFCKRAKSTAEMSEGIWLNRTQETAKSSPDALHRQARRLRGSRGVVKRELGGKKRADCNKILAAQSEPPLGRCRLLTAPLSGRSSSERSGCRRGLPPSQRLS